MVQIKTYLTTRNTDDNKTLDNFQASVRNKVLLHVDGLDKNIEKQLKLSEEETIIYRLLQNPRELVNILESGVMTGEEATQFVYALFKAGVLQISEEIKPRHIVPLEIRKYRNQVRGVTQTSTRPAIKKETLKPKAPAEQKRSTSNKGTQKTTTTAQRKGPPARKKSKNSRLITDPQGKKFDPRRIRIQGTSEQRKAARTVIENYERLMNKDYYNFLCISPKAKDSDIKTAYFSLVREMHPDNLSSLGIDVPEIHELAKLVFGRLNEAYNTLKDFNKRLEYDQKLESGSINTRVMRSGKVRRSRDALMQNKMAESYLKKGQFHKAEEHYRLAIEFDDEVPDFHTSLAWCIATNPRNRSPKLLQRGKEILGETIQRFHHADAAYRLALLCARENDLHTAIQLFDKALTLDPDHSDTVRERKLVIHRIKLEQEALEAKNNPNKGFLSKLFNKKKK